MEWENKKAKRDAYGNYLYRASRDRVLSQARGGRKELKQELLHSHSTPFWNALRGGRLRLLKGSSGDSYHRQKEK